MINASVFDKKQTNIAKGVALLLLLWHHLFFNNPDDYNMFSSLFSVNGIPVESFIADFCKVCVSVFLILSGYGLFKSYSSFCKTHMVNGRLSKGSVAVYVKNHLIRLLSNYWFIFIIFVPLGLLFGRSFLLYYGYNPLYYLADFFGVSYLFFEYGATMNLTWWYMSIIIVYYLIFPLLYRIQKYNSLLLLCVSAFILVCPFIPDFRQLKTWQFSFVLGMFISEKNLIERIDSMLNNIVVKLCFSFVFLVTMAILRYYYLCNTYQFDAVFALSIILFSFLVLSRIPVLNRILEELGKYSGSIFMFHTFIYLYYFKDFIYWFKYSIVIYIVMVIVCYIVARLLSWLMRITRYNKLIDKLILL